MTLIWSFEPLYLSQIYPILPITVLIHILIEYHRKMVFVLGSHRVRRGSGMMWCKLNNSVARKWVFQHIICRAQNWHDVEGQVADRPWLPSRLLSGNSRFNVLFWFFEGFAMTTLDNARTCISNIFIKPKYLLERLSLHIMFHGSNRSRPNTIYVSLWIYQHYNIYYLTDGSLNADSFDSCWFFTWQYDPKWWLVCRFRVPHFQRSL